MCNKKSDKESGGAYEEVENSEAENSEDDETTEGDSCDMTKKELERKVREHMERRRESYEKMGSVDQPR